jgi:hypothetical protein
MKIGALKHGAVIAALVGAVSLAAVTTSSAAWHGRGWGPGAAIGAGVAGLALGAAAAANGPYYGYGPYYGSGYYDYAPGPVVVDPGPTYYGYYADPWRRPGNCRHSVNGC